MKADIEININGEWTPVASFEERRSGGGWLEYESDYVVSYKDTPHARVGLRYPVNFSLYEPLKWPAFLLDIIPSGAGRRVWLRKLGLTDNDSIELNWDLLLAGAGNPPGNLRVAQAAIPPSDIPHPGFSIDDIVAKKSDFIEYAEEMGAIVAGATDIPGDAPKFMVVRDHADRWHPDGALLDNLVVDSWIVKFPRGKTDRDALILRNEAPYYEVARWFGARTGARLFYRDNCLFIPRFDREQVNGKLLRHGLETISSVAEIAVFGRRGDHLEFCRAIAEVASDPGAELYEYLRRDILNAALRNVDNHGRNSAFLKKHGAATELSPLYDFAAMSLDPEGIPRASLWHGMEPSIGRPDWVAVGRSLSDIADVPPTIAFLAAHSKKVVELPAIMQSAGVETQVIQEVSKRCEEIAADLERAGKTL